MFLTKIFKTQKSFMLKQKSTAIVRMMLRKCHYSINFFLFSLFIACFTLFYKLSFSLAHRLKRCLCFFYKVDIRVFEKIKLKPNKSQRYLFDKLKRSAHTPTHTHKIDDIDTNDSFLPTITEKPPNFQANIKWVSFSDKLWQHWYWLCSLKFSWQCSNIL